MGEPASAPLRELAWGEYVRRCAKRDESALAALYDESSQLAYTIALQIPQDEADASEVVLDVYKQVWDSSARFDEQRGSAAAWIVLLARGKNLDWQETPLAGVAIARLYEDPVRGELASLVRMSPGAHYPSHHHASLEHCYVIEGDLIFEDHTLRAGDYSAGSPDKDHASATSKNGCLLFIVHNTRDQVQAH